MTAVIPDGRIFPAQASKIRPAPRSDAPVVCGVDRSDAARAAARFAGALATRLDAPLVLTHAICERESAAGQERERAAALSLLRRLSAELRLTPSDLRVDVGPAASVLAGAAGPRTRGAASHRAGLVAVGGVCGLRPRGSVRRALLRRACAPLAVVPPVSRLGGTEVVCAVRDWSDVATARVAAGFASALGLPLGLVHVLPRSFGGFTRPEPLTPLSLLEQPWDPDAATHLLTAVASACDPAEASIHVLSGSPGPTLARFAEARSSALLVIGDPAHGRIGGALVGSAARHLVHHTRRPLLVCPGSATP